MTELRSSPPCGVCSRVALALGAKSGADLAGLAAFYVAQLRRAENRIRNRDAIDDAITGAQGVVWSAWPLVLFDAVGIHDPIVLMAAAVVVGGTLTGLSSLIVRRWQR